MVKKKKKAVWLSSCVCQCKDETERNQDKSPASKGVSFWEYPLHPLPEAA